MSKSHATNAKTTEASLRVFVLVYSYCCLRSGAQSLCDWGTGPQGALMPVLSVRPAGKTHPFGDERTVDQAIPAAVKATLADPFLMCDDFKSASSGVSKDPDHFPVGWHPHRGMDILSYLKTGVGRHGDSMGNRETFATPGMQWISCGSGIEHAEGGGTPKGEVIDGFQIWVNVPAKHKMDEPSYGTEPPESIPMVELAPGAQGRVLAGDSAGRKGPFRTKQPVLIMDLELTPGARLEHLIPQGLDTCIVYVYEGAGTVGGRKANTKDVVLLDATSASARRLELAARPSTKLHALLFAGKRLNEPIAWHGPIVMNTQKQLRETFAELRSGSFPPTRAAWDYKRIATRPNERDAELRRRAAMLKRREQDELNVALFRSTTRHMGTGAADRGEEDCRLDSAAAASQPVDRTA